MSVSAVGVCTQRASAFCRCWKAGGGLQRASAAAHSRRRARTASDTVGVRTQQGSALRRPRCTRPVAVQPRAAQHALGPCAPRPGLPTPAPGRAGQAAPAGQGGYSRPWRGARALRARPPREGAAHKGRVCADAPPSARPPAARGWGRETPPGPPPARTPTPWAAADTAPGGHQREAGSAGHGRGSRADAGGSRAHGPRAQGAPAGPLVRVGACALGDLGGQAPALRPRGDFSVSSTLLCLQLSNLGPEEAGTPACRGGGREGRLGPGSAPLSTPGVWGEGGVEGRPNEGSQDPALS